jgi:glycosyltransferase involved in cell wall biosynthesis
MRVGVFHNRYAQRGGEDAAVDLEVEQLRKAGCEVHLFTVESGEVTGTWERARALWRAPFDPEMAERTAGFLARHPVDLIHVHNSWPLLTPAVHLTGMALGLPVVQTLHNYRLACARADFLREGRTCRACVTDGPWQAARYGCWKDSRLASAAWARAITRQRRQGAWTTLVDSFIAPSAFAKRRLVETAGLPADRIEVLPNPVADPGEPAPPGQGGIYVGRLAAEKGVGLLLDAWRELGDAPLTIVGDGPESEALRARAEGLPNVRFTGVLAPDGVRAELSRAAFAVAPSLCDETFGLAAAEALALGRPVVVPEDTALAELAHEGRTGLCFRRGDSASLAAACRQLLHDPDRTAELGREARIAYEEHYAPEPRSERLLALYRSFFV